MDTRRFIKLFTLLITLAFYSGHGWADSFQQGGSVRISTQYNSNPAMSTGIQESIWQGFLEPTYTLKKADGAYELSSVLDLLIARSSNTTLNENRNDPSVFLNLRRQIKLGEIDVAVKYDELSTRTAEVDITGPNAVDSTRFTRTTSGTWSEAVSERSTFSMNGAYTDVSYSGGAYTDYVSPSGGAKLSYSLSEYSAIFANATYADSETAIAHTYFANGLFGWNWRASDYLEGTLQAGKIKLSGAAATNQATAELKFTGQKAGLVLFAGRQAAPTGLGDFVVVDRIKGNWSYALSDNSKIGIDLTDQKSWLVNDIFYRTAGAWLQHDLNSSWMVRTYYSYNTTEQVGAGRGLSNLLGISLVYRQTDL